MINKCEKSYRISLQLILNNGYLEHVKEQKL